MLNKILFIFEGKDTEHRINSSVLKCFFENRNTIVECVFGAEIYQLYVEIEKNANLDVFQLIKERSDDELLSKYKRSDFAEIYLFFDYDGHSTLAEDKTIINLLTLFDNETENGKLLISYPMVESIKHIKAYGDFKTVSVQCKQNIHYKKLIPTECIDNKYLDFRKYSKSMWQNILLLHISKMNYIVNDKYELPDLIINQAEIFTNQLTKYITPHATVSVLSAFPIFIHDYFGNKRTLEFISDQDKI